MSKSNQKNRNDNSSQKPSNLFDLESVLSFYILIAAIVMTGVFVGELIGFPLAIQEGNVAVGLLWAIFAVFIARRIRDITKSEG